MIGQVPRWQLEDWSFAIEREGRIVAVVPLHHVAADRRLASSGWGWVGPVLVGGMHPRFEARVLRLAIAEMRAIATRLGARQIAVAAPAITPRSLSNRWGINPFSAHGFADVSTVTRVIDLGIDEASLWAGLSADARQQIRRARESGYSAAIEDWASVVEDYHRVHDETYARSGLPAHPREYFEGLARWIGPAGLSVLMVGRSPAGRPVAFHNTVRLGVAAIYSTGCSETAHLDSGVNYLAFWEAMLAAKRAGCAWYEAGDVALASDDPKIRGLATFKSKFGGENHRYFRGIEDLSQQRTATIELSSAPPPCHAAVLRWRSASNDLLVACLAACRRRAFGFLSVARQSESRSLKGAGGQLGEGDEPGHQIDDERDNPRSGT